MSVSCVGQVGGDGTVMVMLQSGAATEGRSCQRNSFITDADSDIRGETGQVCCL